MMADCRQPVAQDTWENQSFINFSPSGRSSPIGDTCRYKVCRVTPSSSQSALTLVCGLPMDAIARRSLAGVILNGRPPLRPRARAEAKPATVRSEISSRSNSANEAKIPRTSLPAALVVSIAAPCPLSTFKPTPRAIRSCTVLIKWRKSRPSLCSFQTASVSPSRSALGHAAKPGRSSPFRRPDLHRGVSGRHRPTPAHPVVNTVVWEPSAFDTRM